MSRNDDRLLLGVDGGGTSTEAWLARVGGGVIGRGKAGPSNAKAVGEESARQALEHAIAGAFSSAGLIAVPAASACFGIAGFGRPEDGRLLASWSRDARWAETLTSVTDGDLVVAAGTPEGWGVGIIAGTGSIALGRSADGRTARAGGWGYLMGDEGSAYAVALAALRLVARRADGRDPKSPWQDHLTDRLCRALNVESPAQIVTALYAPGFDRTRIAALAPEVILASRDDPELVDRLLHPAGAELAEQAITVSRTLGWQSGDLPVALAGGFLLSAPDVSAALINGLTDAGYRVSATAVTQPVRGAIVIAERKLTGPKA